jgi:carboxymethylenebutenolidase
VVALALLGCGDPSSSREGTGAMADREPGAAADLGAVFDARVRHEFEDRDLAATMRTIVAEPYVYHVPTMTGGRGQAGVREFYGNHFIGKWPADTRVERVSRTVGADQVVDEFVLSFTHDSEIDVLLPGIAPTGRKVELPHVVVMRFEGGRIAHEHIYWDQASLLVQVGLLDPERLPAVGAEQARGLRDPSLPRNALLER